MFFHFDGSLSWFRLMDESYQVVLHQDCLVENSVDMTAVLRALRNTTLLANEDVDWSDDVFFVFVVYSLGCFSMSK